MSLHPSFLLVWVLQEVKKDRSLMQCHQLGGWHYLQIIHTWEYQVDTDSLGSFLGKITGKTTQNKLLPAIFFCV